VWTTSHIGGGDVIVFLGSGQEWRWQSMWHDVMRRGGEDVAMSSGGGGGRGQRCQVRDEGCWGRGWRRPFLSIGGRGRTDSEARRQGRHLDSGQSTIDRWGQRNGRHHRQRR
jgi:hypothetical protein